MDQEIDPKIQDLLDRFEATWKSAIDGGQPPSLEDAVLDIDESSRHMVLRFLRDIEGKYRGTWQSRQDYAATKPGAVDETVDVHGSQPSSADAIDGQVAADLAPTQEIKSDATDGAAANDPDVTTEFSDEPRREHRGPANEQPATPTVPGYSIHRILGRGGMGVVYKARHHALNRTVALKMILAGSEASQDQLNRFYAEAEAVAQLTHPNIVQVYDVGRYHGLPYFSLEYVDGHALSEEIEGQPVNPDRAAQLVEVVARAMHFAHESGLLHRDLKPANILLTSEGVPKVTDFGLVKRLEGDAGQTRTGVIMGTPRYMAPEQGRGEKTVGIPADVYALGGILYCALSGRAPFVGATGMDTLLQLLNEDPVPLGRLQPGTPRDLETICMKCLEKEPVKRYASAGDLAEDLRRFQAGEPIDARPVTTFERAWRWCRRNPRVAVPSIAAAVLALALALGGPFAAVVVYQQKELAEMNEEAALTAREVAQQNEQIAEAAKDEALQARDDAQRNEKLARDARNVAGQQGRVALDALADMVRKVQAELQNKSGMQPLRQSLLDTAMQHVNKVNEFEVDENFRDALVASVHRRLGDVFLDLGHGPKSVENYQKCLAIVRSLHEEGNLPNPQHNLSDVLNRLGQAERQAGDLQSAKQHFLEALEIRRAWEKAQPHNNYIPQNVAASLGFLGNVSLAMGNVDEAAEFFQESLELRKSWVEWAPDSVSARSEHAGALEAMARVSIQRGKMAEAETLISQASDILAEILIHHPDQRSLKWNVALFRKQLASVQLLADKPEAASTAFEQAIEPLDELSREDPLNSLIRRNVAEAEYGLATALLELSDPQAEAHFDRSLQLRRQLVKDDPENPSERAALVLTLARVGDHEDAANLANTLLANYSENSEVLYLLAAGYAVCSRVEATDDELRNRYGELAVDALQRAIDHGYDITADLGADPDFEPLLPRDDFQALLKARARTGESE